MNEIYDPRWTEQDYRGGDARDALRIETAGEAILEDLLPGINTVTNRARYYSFWAWVLHEFIEFTRANLSEPNQRDFYEWLRPREDMLILAHLSHGHRTGAVGTDQGHRFWQNGERDSRYPLDWKSLASASGGAYQANYSGALEEMNIVVREADLPYNALQKPIGLRLAEAYGRAVGDTEYVRRYWHADRVPRSVVEDFAEAGCLCEASRFPDERGALIHAFFRFDTADVRAKGRLASLCLLLDVIEQARGAPLDLRSMRAVLYFWSYGADHPYIPEGNLIESATRWRFFQLRQYYVFGIECLWALFLNRIRDRRCTPEEYLGWLFVELDLEAVGERYGVRWPTYNPAELTVREFLDAVEDAVGEERFMPGPAALKGDLNEHALYLALDWRASDSDASLWAGAGLLMLGLLRRRCRGWREDAGWASDGEGEERLSVEVYLGHVRRAIDEGWTMTRWLSWFHERYLWLRHRRVALEKMMARGKDPALFEWEKGKFCGLHEDRPKMNNPRIENALRIMEDLELIRQGGGGNRPIYTLTPDGEGLLQRFRACEAAS